MTTKKEILKAIRKNCLECCNGSYSKVRNCQYEECRLYLYRFGHDPKPKIKGFAKSDHDHTFRIDLFAKTHRTCEEFCTNAP